jgi:mono/diheme cytochrome c family protein
MRRVLIAVLALVPLLQGCSGGRDVSPVGAALYAKDCATCHGPGGRGDGPVAETLTPRPADLTRLTADLPELIKQIDGRATVRAHGTSAMPVWGEVFAEGLIDEPKARQIAALRLQALAEHVRSLRAAR